MTTRSEELRQRDRRVLLVSLLVAAVLHAAVLFLVPATQVPVLVTSGDSLVLEEGRALFSAWDSVHAFFGPPEIRFSDGSTRPEPSDRVLDAGNVSVASIGLPDSCRGRAAASVVPVSARVGVHLDHRGLVDGARIIDGTGDGCRDGLLVAVASSVWYQWIPSDRIPAPVDLVQPISLSAPQTQ